MEKKKLVAYTHVVLQKACLVACKCCDVVDIFKTLRQANMPPRKYKSPQAAATLHSPGITGL